LEDGQNCGTYRWAGGSGATSLAGKTTSSLGEEERETKTESEREREREIEGERGQQSTSEGMAISCTSNIIP